MDNQILCEITIKKEDINKPIHLLNHFNTEKKKYTWNRKFKRNKR